MKFNLQILKVLCHALCDHFVTGGLFTTNALFIGYESPSWSLIGYCWCLLFNWSLDDKQHFITVWVANTSLTRRLFHNQYLKHWFWKTLRLKYVPYRQKTTVICGSKILIFLEGWWHILHNTCYIYPPITENIPADEAHLMVLNLRYFYGAVWYGL